MIADRRPCQAAPDEKLILNQHNPAASQFLERQLCWRGGRIFGLGLEHWLWLWLWRWLWRWLWLGLRLRRWFRHGFWRHLRPTAGNAIKIKRQTDAIHSRAAVLDAVKRSGDCHKIANHPHADILPVRQDCVYFAHDAKSPRFFNALTTSLIV
jgi:hypothetical protein